MWVKIGQNGYDVVEADTKIMCIALTVVLQDMHAIIRCDFQEQFLQNLAAQPAGHKDKFKETTV